MRPSSTSHSPNAYPSSYHPQLASRPYHQPPSPQDQHQPYPANNHRHPGPAKTVRSGSKDSTASGQPSPNKVGRDPHPDRERRQVWDARAERKTRLATTTELANKSRDDPRHLKKSTRHHLRDIELANSLITGKPFTGDFERVFDQLTTASRLIWDWMPSDRDQRRDPRCLEAADQRRHLRLNGGPETLEDHLAQLAKLKPGLAEHCDKRATKDEPRNERAGKSSQQMR